MRCGHFFSLQNKPLTMSVVQTKAANPGSFCTNLPDPDAHGARRGFYFGFRFCTLPMALSEPCGIQKPLILLVLH